MYKIAINALGLKNGSGGVETYTYNLLKALLENDKDNEYYLYVGKNLENIFEGLLTFKNLKIIAYPINTNNSTIRIIAENTILPISLIKNRINLVHHVCNYMPRISPVKSIVTLHDMVAFFYQESYPEYKNMYRFYNYFRKAMAFTAKNASKIIAVSEFTKKEFLKNYDVNDDKVIVIGQSIDTRKKKYSPDIKVIEKLNIKKPYILSVSVIRPHKNFDFLVRVFNKLKEKYNIPHQLVIVGGVHFGAESFFNEVNKSVYREDIKHLGYLTELELSSVYNYAELFVFPSLYEGFGIPVLEAMEYNLPVVASNEAAMPEVGGEACLYFNPYDENDACDKIFHIINSPEKNNFKEQINKFNWDMLANKLLEILINHL